jgi:hypothetical protein
MKGFLLKPLTWWVFIDLRDAILDEDPWQADARKWRPALPRA